MASYSENYSNLEKVQTALEQGLLFCHQFEFGNLNFSNENSPINEFLKTLFSEKGKECFSTSFLHKELGNPVYTVVNRVGLLFDGIDSKNLKCLFVSPRLIHKSYSETTKDLSIIVSGSEKSLEMQFGGLEGKLEFSYPKDMNVEGCNISAREALKEIVRAAKIQPLRRTNEAVICAKSDSLKGIIFSTDKIIDSNPQFYNLNQQKIEALALKAFIKEKHNIDLPLIGYKFDEAQPEKRFNLLDISRSEFKEICFDIKRRSANQEATESLLKLAERGFNLQQKSIENYRQ
jgi:hypothetical protein